METQCKLYNSYVPGERYTEIYSEHITLKVEFTKNEGVLKNLNEMNKLRFITELKMPGHKALQTCYSTLDLLKLRASFGDTAFERVCPEDSAETYLRTIRHDISNNLPRFISMDNYQQLTGEKNNISGGAEKNLGINWSVLSPYSGDTFIVLEGNNTTLAAKGIEEEYKVLGKIRTGSSIVLQIPHIEKQNFNADCLFRYLSPEKDEFNGYGINRVVSIFTYSYGTKEEKRLEIKGDTAMLYHNGIKSDASDMLKTLFKNKVSVSELSDEQLKSIIKGETIHVHNKDFHIVKSVWGYNLRVRENLNTNLNESVNEM